MSLLLKQILLIFVLVLFINTGCKGAPIRASADVCSKPKADSFWQSSDPKDSGFDSEKLCKILRKSASEKGGLHSLLIERHGKIVSEIYNDGDDKPLNLRYGLRLPFDGTSTFDSQTLHDVRSVTKSIVSLLFGIAIEKGLIEGVDSSVLSSFPEIEIPENDTRRKITWKHLLTMSSGLDWEEWRSGFFFSDETRLYWKKNLVEFVFDREVSDVPGSVFNYNGGGTSVLAEVLTKKTGKSLKELAGEWILYPIGIEKFEWVEDWHGRGLAFAGLRLKPRDMLRIGRLILNEGVWNKKQIVPKKWIQDSLGSEIATNVSFFRKDGSVMNYGYQWWIGETRLTEKNVSWKAALGNGGQLIYVIPELDMVVATTAGEYGSPKIIFEIGNLLDEIIVSANR
ncbi:serine hydrolase domain-containing protein [Leptospira adleri]|uniref:serine hydrolase domain-containing protein n=1 Tax=Leptospira adleri TaxID=2023186 RepID=UPI001083A7E0|nr:serine hydrolase [Leptospira adleri]TGM60244.1 class C beta-lactamase-related serine hydrolase [Leptospira adleri]